MKTNSKWAFAFLLIAISSIRIVAAPLGTAFTYQGRLLQGSIPANGTSDFQFSLWGVATGGSQFGATITLNDVMVTNGLFTVELNTSGQFGPNAFQGLAHWLQIAVRPGNSPSNA